MASEQISDRVARYGDAGWSAEREGHDWKRGVFEQANIGPWEIDSSRAKCEASEEKNISQQHE